ncbi:glutathione reductase [Klebsiella pneumoniae]|nr:glutathione reductase [Klebsiella pneumoniae]
MEVNGEIITADHILIATGGRPSHPDIPGVEYGIDSDGFFELPALPKRVAVVGAGYIAVELAGVINGLGAETHLFVRKHAPLRSFDPLIVETLVEVMNAEGRSCIPMRSESGGEECRRQPDAGAGRWPQPDR